MHKHNSPKTWQIWNLGTPLVGYRPPPRVIHFWKALFRDISIADSIGLYLASFRSYTALKTTLFKTSLEQCNILNYWIVPYIFRMLFSRSTFTSQLIRLYAVPFRSYLALKLTILENSTYLVFCGSCMGLPLRTIHSRKFCSRAISASQAPLFWTVEKL